MQGQEDTKQLPSHGAPAPRLPEAARLGASEWQLSSQDRPACFHNRSYTCLARVSPGFLSPVLPPAPEPAHPGRSLFSPPALSCECPSLPSPHCSVWA